MLERFFSLEATLGRRLVPFALVAVLGVASTALPPEPASWEVIAAAAAGLTIVSAVAFAIPWRRLPRWSWVLPALAFLAVVAALRHAHGGAVSGYAPLSLLPVVWAALYLRLREVLVVVTAAGLTVLLPALTDSAAYGSSEYRRALLLCAVALLVGTAIASFVGQQDRLAAAARAQAGELATSNRIITAMARLAHEHATDGALREAICAEACNALGASVATIVEPDRTGELHVTAASGIPMTTAELRDRVRPVASTSAFRTGVRLHVPDVGAEPGVSTLVVGLTGIRTMVYQPIVSLGDPIGVLCVGWEERLERLDRATDQALTLLAAEAAVSIERSERVARLDTLARTDPATGLLNRRAFEELLEHAAGVRPPRPFCVAMVDLDRFKAYNDANGHQAGDRLLREVTAAWTAALRESDALARYGGDEFVVLLRNCALEDAAAIVDRLRLATPAPVACSIGLAEWDGAEPPADLLLRADAALYAAKRGGGDRLVVRAAQTGPAAGDRSF